MHTSKKQINDLNDLVNIVNSINRSGGQIWWRGHTHATYKLIPSVFREVGEHGYNYEQNIIERFQQRAISRRTNAPKKEEWFEWLFLMQHYRLPTRLLDWTESPLIACYFAVTGAEKDGDTDKTDGALFALSPYRLNFHQIEIEDLLTSEYKNAKDYVRKAFDVNAQNDPDKVVALLSQEIDVRMAAQLSAFTVHSSGLAIDDIDGNESYVIKYVIPAKTKALLRKQLKHLGVRPSSVFPDLEHLAREIKDLKFNHPGKLFSNPGFKELDDK